MAYFGEPTHIIGEGFLAYIRHVTMFKSLSNYETLQLFDQYRNGDEQAFKKIAEGNLWLVIKCAIQNFGAGVSLEDLIQEGNLGLLRAIQSFDHKVYPNFTSYANKSIYQSIRDSYNFLPYLIRLPLNQLYLYKKIQTFKNDFELCNGYEPCLEQIRIDEEISDDMLTFLYQIPDNLNDIIVEADIDSFESDLPTVDTLYSHQYLDKYLDILLSELTDREKDLIRMTYGIWCREMTLAEAGSKFGITHERVRQILENALHKLTRSVTEKRKQAILTALEKKKKQREYCSLNEVLSIDKGRLYSIIQDLLDNNRENNISAPSTNSNNIDDEMMHEEAAIPQNKVDELKKSYVVSNKKVNKTVTSYRGLNIGDRIIYNAKSGPIKCEILEIYDTRNRLRVLYDNGIIDNIPIDFDLIFTNNRVAINRYKLDQKRRETERKERLLNNKKTWFDNSVGIKWIKCQLADKKTKYEIIQAFNKFHRLGYPDFSSKNGCLIDSSPLSLWLKELAKYEPDSWRIDGSGNYIYRGRDIVILRKFIDNYFKNTQPERPQKDRRKS